MVDAREAREDHGHRRALFGSLVTAVMLHEPSETTEQGEGDQAFVDGW